MSIMGKDTVTVILRETREGASGRLVPVEVGRVTVVGRMHESTSTDIQDVAAVGEAGVGVLTLKRFTCRHYPGDDLSQVIDAEGVKYNVAGEPKRHRASRRTRRDAVLLRQTGVKRGIRG